MMRERMRLEPSLFRTMQHEVALHEKRQQHLLEKMLDRKAGPVRKRARLADEWDTGASLPTVQLEQASVGTLASFLPRLHPRQLEAGRFLVSGSKGGRDYTVDFNAFQRGEYHLACTCGVVASSLTVCKHFKRCVCMDSRTQASAHTVNMERDSAYSNQPQVFDGKLNRLEDDAEAMVPTWSVAEMPG